MNKTKQKFKKKIKDKKPFFLLTIGNTETGKIEGISAAGKNPKMTDYTPVADAEYLYYGKCKCIEGVPISPTGIPTPAILSKACTDLIKPNYLSIKTGLNIETSAPMVNIDSKPGNDIRKEIAVQNPKNIYENSKVVGESLSKNKDDRYYLLGESIAGGTTTALGVLRALGYNAMVSSSLEENPVDLKREVIKKGMEKSNISIGSLKGKPFKAIKTMGDPIIPTIAGLAVGLDSFIVLSGGTQMAAVAAVLKELNELDNTIIGTTKWIMNDNSNNIEELASKIDINLLNSNISFKNTEYKGLKAYEKGVVKEGVGAGGLMLSAEQKVGREKVTNKIEKTYKKTST